MLFNRERALQKMDQYGLDALVAATPRNVYYASGFWTRISEWGFQENHAAVIVPRDPAKPAILVVPEFAISGLLETPTWIPQVRTTEFMNTSHVAHEPEPVRLDPLQGDIEALYAEKIAGDMAPNLVLGTDQCVGGAWTRKRAGRIRRPAPGPTCESGIDRPASRRRH